MPCGRKWKWPWGLFPIGRPETFLRFARSNCASCLGLGWDWHATLAFVYPYRLHGILIQILRFHRQVFPFRRLNRSVVCLSAFQVGMLIQNSRHNGASDPPRAVRDCFVIHEKEFKFQ